MPIDLNNIPQEDRDLVPPGVYRLEATVVPGDAGENGILTLAKNGRSLMLRLLCKVVGGDYAGYGIWDRITVGFDERDDPDLPPIDKLNNYRTSVRLGLKKLLAIVNSTYALLPNDDSDAAREKRELSSYGEVHGLKFWAQVDERPGRGGYGPSNVIDYIITPDLPDYPKQSAPAIAKAVAPPKRPLANDLDDTVPFN